MQSNWAICGSKKSRFIKEQQARGLLSNLGIKTPLNKVPLLNILTVCSYHVTYVFQSESTLYSCLNVKELLALSRHEI